MNATMRVQPDGKSPTASGKTLKSGYGFNEFVSSNVSTNQSSAVTGAQNAVTYFPEFQYKTYWIGCQGAYSHNLSLSKTNTALLSEGHTLHLYGCLMAGTHRIPG